MYKRQDLPYLGTAAEFGFRPLRIEDITPNVLPTIEMIDHAVTQSLEPTIRFAEAYVTARAPWKTKLFRLFFGKEDKELARVLKKLKRKTDPDRFQERFRYATVLLEAS